MINDLNVAQQTPLITHRSKVLIQEDKGNSRIIIEYKVKIWYIANYTLALMQYLRFLAQNRGSYSKQQSKQGKTIAEENCSYALSESRSNSDTTKHRKSLYCIYSLTVLIQISQAWSLPYSASCLA